MSSGCSSLVVLAFCLLAEVREDVTGAGAFPNIDARTGMSFLNARGGRESSPAQPILQIVQADRYVLGVVWRQRDVACMSRELTLVEDPDFAGGCRLRYTMAIIVEYRSLVPCRAPQGHTLLLCLFYRWVEMLPSKQIPLWTAYLPLYT